MNSDLRVAAASSVELRSTVVAQAYVQAPDPVKKRWVTAPSAQDPSATSSTTGGAPERSMGLGKGSISPTPRWFNVAKVGEPHLQSLRPRVRNPLGPKQPPHQRQSPKQNQVEQPSRVPTQHCRCRIYPSRRPPPSPPEPPDGRGAGVP